MKRKVCSIFRCFFLLIISLSLFATGGCDNKEKPITNKPQYRVGILLGVKIFSPVIDGFKAEFAEMGYKEGEDIIFDVKDANGSRENMKKIAEQFVAEEVDLIFSITTGASLAAKRAVEGKSIPLVFAIASEPHRTGVVKSLTEPEKGITGIHTTLILYIGKRLEFLLKFSPSAKSVAVPHDPSYPVIPLALEGLKHVSNKLNMNLVKIAVKKPEEILSGLEEAFSISPFDAILIMPDTTTQNPTGFQAMQKFADNHKIPLIANAPNQIDKGALFCYRWDSLETGRMVSKLAKKMLEGDGHLVIPISNTIPHLTINKKVADKLGIVIDSTLLEIASKVIH